MPAPLLRHSCDSPPTLGVAPVAKSKKTDNVAAMRQVPRVWPGLGLLALLVCVGCGNDQHDDVPTHGETTGTASSTDADPPTWHRDIAPIFIAKCGGCHRQDGVGPMLLDDYGQAVTWAQASLLAIESGKMPPYAARVSAECSPRLPFRDDLSLLPNDVDAVRRWIAAGTPLGDPAQSTPIPEQPQLDLPNPSWTGVMPTAVAIEPGNDKFFCMVIDPQLTSMKFFDGMQVVPGNQKIVHHVLVFSASDATLGDKPGSDGIWECDGGGLVGDALIGVWAPGAPAVVSPPEAATVLDVGSKLVLNVHYHPTPASSEVDSQTAVKLRWRESIPPYLSLVGLLGNASTYDAEAQTGLLPGENDAGKVEFRVPAGVANHAEHQVIEFAAGISPLPELMIWGVGSHMHYVGTDQKMVLIRKSPRANEPAQECLLHTPYWDFDWQRGYYYDAPLADVPKIRHGDRLHIDCKYNNTLDNLKVRDALAEQSLTAPIDVVLGEGSLNEMCLGLFAIAVPTPGVAKTEILRTHAQLLRSVNAWRAAGR